MNSSELSLALPLPDQPCAICSDIVITTSTPPQHLIRLTLTIPTRMRPNRSSFNKLLLLQAVYHITMGVRRMKVSIDELSLPPFDDGVSVDSGEPGNALFFGKKLLTAQPHPSHTSSVTWKSNAVKEKEEFERVKQRVRHFAPEQFRPNAKPGKRPSEIFPQNAAEWVNHKMEILAMAEVQKEKNCELLKAEIAARQKISKDQRKIKSVLGPDGKIFKDGLSPVLCLPTIWSLEYTEHGNQVAKWPSAGELQWNGDDRQNVFAKTKCGRFLPPPRAPAKPPLTFQDQPFLKALPLDQTGPIFTMGPRPNEIQMNNLDMNNAPEFEEQGHFYLGTELMEELGEWKPSCVPDWLQAQQVMDRELVAYNYDIDPELGYEIFPDVDGEFWYDGGVLDQEWEDIQVWW